MELFDWQIKKLRGIAQSTITIRRGRAMEVGYNKEIIIADCVWVETEAAKKTRLPFNWGIVENIDINEIVLNTEYVGEL